MIFETILQGLLNVLKVLFTGIKAIFPMISIPGNLYNALGIILSTTQQANNFMYFIMGDTAFIIIPSLLLLLTYKYAIYPVLTLVIGVFVNKAE